jgi:hypothetical protein
LTATARRAPQTVAAARFFRLAYGFLEILIGMFVIIGTMGREPELVDPSLLLVQIAAGMYVIIRRQRSGVQSTMEFGEGAEAT